ncbi:MAG: hypothetical protein IJ805_07355 [Lachnospiraceae bacterium]|nr:hypothetical protein [Lachnospiraceae bacterium]
MDTNSYDLKRKEDNIRAVESKNDRQKREQFLSDERIHILKLTSVILKRSVTVSDDEFSVAFIAVSEAIDGYDPQKNDFWPYAAYVIRNRLADLYRKESSRAEVLVSPGAFEGNTDEEEAGFDVSLEVREQIKVRSLGVNNTLKDEIEAFDEELSKYGISLSDLADCSPKSKKTRSGCADIIRAIFLPPSLAGQIIKTGKIPISDVMMRGRLQKKLFERHRKYLIAATLILSGDYPRLSEYVESLKPSVENIISFEERRMGS